MKDKGRVVGGPDLGISGLVDGVLDTVDDMLAVGEGWLRGEIGIFGRVCVRIGDLIAEDDNVLSFTDDAKFCGILCIVI